MACPFGAPRSDALCVGVDCSALDGTCAVGVCDYATGSCHSVPRAEGASCGPVTPSCTEQRCVAGSCTTVTASDCAACMTGRACDAGACVAPPTTLTYDFESGVLPAGWSAGTGAAAWTVTSALAHGGTHAARAGTITDRQQTQMQMTISLTSPAALSFWSSVDSEAMFDLLRVFVDGVMAAQWSGSMTWTQTTLTLTAGTHTIEWRYVKDVSISVGMDTAWIDDVVVTPVTPGTPLCGS